MVMTIRVEKMGVMVMTIRAKNMVEKTIMGAKMVTVRMVKMTMMRMVKMMTKAIVVKTLNLLIVA